MDISFQMRKAARRAQRALNLITVGAGSKFPVGESRFRANALYVNQLSLRNVHERWMDRAYRSALATRGGTFIDVGANIGQTLLKVLAIDPDQEYVGFEPQLGCAFFVDDFIRTNELKHHRLFPIGISNRNGTLTLYRRMTDDGMASSTPGFRADGFYNLMHQIYVAHGDEFLDELEIPEVGLIKVDVEGGELEVIQGLSRTITKHQPFVFFEALNHDLVDEVEQKDESTRAFREERVALLESELRSCGLTIMQIRASSGLSTVASISLREHSATASNDYVAVPPDLVAGFTDRYASLG